MSTVKSKKLQVGTDATSTNNFTIYQPASPDGTLRVGVGNADSPTEVGKFNSNGYVATNAPAIRVHIGGSHQSIPHATFTKLQLNTKVFDTTSDFDNSTNYRFTPSVEGYYLITVNGFLAGLSDGKYAISTIYKNGSEVHRGTQVLQGGVSSSLSVASGLIYMNGSTDYVESYIYHNYGSSRNANADERYNNMTAFLARAV